MTQQSDLATMFLLAGEDVKISYYLFGELPPIFPFDGTHGAFEVRQGSPTRS